MANCTITMKPYADGAFVSHMDIEIVFDKITRAASTELFRFALSTVTIPGCEPEGLSVTDENGAVELSERDSSEYPYEYRIYTAGRKTHGSLAVRYTVRPVPYREGQRAGPYFDLKTEEGGANTSGLSILPTLEKAGEFEGDIRLKWDMSEMPEGVKGVNTFGEGDIVHTGKFEDMRQSYYAFGSIKSITDGDFGFYWIADTNFDAQAIADYTKKLFSVMSPFFRDTESIYRIFVRKDPEKFPSSGGTALQRSYMFGWNENKPVNVEEKQNILAHEMVHNWPNLNDEPYGITTWYAEGTAEYYSIMLPLRAGLITKETALYEIQRRTDDYYCNPTRHLENMESTRLAWKDRRAQKIPYGRGIFFLANCDVKMKEATDGKYGIDDVVLNILDLGRNGVTLGNEVFLAEVKKLSGLDLTEDWEIMRKGVHFAPLGEGFGGFFTVKEIEAKEADTGLPCVSYIWELKE